MLGDWRRRPASISRPLETSLQGAPRVSTWRRSGDWPTRWESSLANCGDAVGPAERIGGPPPLVPPGLLHWRRTIGYLAGIGMWIPIPGSSEQPDLNDAMLPRREFPVPAFATTRPSRRVGMEARSGDRTCWRERCCECLGSG